MSDETLDREELSVPSSEQAGTPFAIVQGTALTELPKDLYIPPDALEVFLEAFAGPLDLLLYLIRRQNLDILDIPIAEITRQYVEYVELMKEMRLELAAEYLVMAAILTEIKSQMLLPRHEAEKEGDPRAELERRLREYEQFKQAAETLEGSPQVGRDIHLITALTSSAMEVPKVLPEVSVDELLQALAGVLARTDSFANHRVSLKSLSVRERMTELLKQINADGFTEFTTLLVPEQGKLGVIVTFLAVLELIHDALLEMTQVYLYGPIHLRAVT